VSTLLPGRIRTDLFKLVSPHTNTIDSLCLGRLFGDAAIAAGLESLWEKKNGILT